MCLSKVYRGEEFSRLDRFQFRSFSDPKSTDIAPTEAKNSTPAAGLESEKKVNEAFTRGRQEGAADVESRLDTTLQALTRALEEVNRLRESVAHSSSQDMLRMVMAISEQVIRRELEVQPDIVLGVIENALQSSIQADDYRIWVSPQDLELVKEQKPLFLASIRGLKNISFQGDATLTPGGCRIESDFGDVDATIESQLEKIHETLGGALAETG